MLGSSYRYDPYGVLVSGTPDAVNYYGYNGESTGAKTGLQYLRARYYQASTGTFTSEDSDLGSKREPLTRNRYAYVTNNPANYQDPSGHGKIWNAVKKVGKKIANAARNLGKKAKKAVKSYLNMVNKAAAKSTNPQRSAARPAPAPVPNLPGKKRAQERTPYPDRNRNPLPAPGERHPVRGVNLGNGMYMPGQRPTHYYYQASYQERAENVIREKVVHKVCIPGGTYVDYGSPEHKKAVIATAQTGFLFLIGAGAPTGGGSLSGLGTSLPGFTVSAGGTVAASAAVSDATILSLAKAGVLGSVLYAVASNKMPDGILGSRDDRNGFGGLKKTYNSIKDSPKYPEGFRPRKNGTTRNTVKNKELLDKLREIESGVEHSQVNRHTF